MRAWLGLIALCASAWLTQALSTDDSAPCTVFTQPSASAVNLPDVLGIQWDSSYDTQWWLGNFEDTEIPGRMFGVELSIGHFVFQGNCSDQAGLVLVCVGISDSHTQTYTQQSLHFDVNKLAPGVHSTHTPYNVSVTAMGMDVSVRQTSDNPLQQTINVAHVPGWDNSFMLSLATSAALSDVHMANDGWLDFLVYFAQVSQPELKGNATLNLAGTKVKATGALYLQHMFGSWPSYLRTQRHELGVLGNGTLTWTWQCARLDNVGLDLALTKFNGVNLQYLNVINRTTGETTYYSGNQFQVTLSDMWTSKASGHTYARHSKVTIPTAGIMLQWATYVPDNEHFIPHILTYYEAASYITGSVKGVAVTGSGYLEHRVA